MSEDAGIEVRGRRARVIALYSKGLSRKAGCESVHSKQGQAGSEEAVKKRDRKAR